MIIFNLDGTLADCEHRRHFVDPKKNADYVRRWHPTLEEAKENKIIPEEYIHAGRSSYPDVISGKHQIFKADWKSFFEACDKDKPIKSVIEIWNDEISLGMMGSHQIWSGRCESSREKTEKWLDKNLLLFDSIQLKMRPIGDDTPEHLLKELWLEDIYEETKWGRKSPIEIVFDSDPESIKMWKRRGIFVFDCNQN